jgi:diaminohydroxyphosphoribosylaminopyrimidine deaminase/5-amino-6-(5-phosphoribosylamino)uracil reductase
MTENDRPIMLRALDLAERGRGYVEPNPLVGAVIERGGHIVGEGWHQRFGEAHAEVNALAAAGDAAQGATLYVTLEPCCHQGKTPPCTQAIIKAGIKRVVAAMLDPFEQVAGQGAKALKAAGIAVDVGMCESAARRLNAPYLTLLSAGRPYVHAKWGMTLDGKICTRTGDSKWITNEAARRRVHELRGRMDAIIVGIGTVLADDPLLTARPPGPRTATRIILDSEGRLPLSTRLLQTAKASPVIVVTADEVPEADPLRQAGCEVLTLGGKLGRPPVVELLSLLAKKRMTNILVEGGSEVLGSFFDAGLVDEVWAFVAPTIIGGAGKSPVGGVGVERMAGAWGVTDWSVESIENNVLLRGYCRR